MIDEVTFLAIDEIQLAADPDRGHVFTERLLHARGRVETMFLGAETIKPLIRKLVPGVQFVTRPRFSKLLYTGAKKLTRLPRRSAVVAFSVSEVYGIAELIRRHRGGAAVVMGALSPRTRNAQVALYQNGDVDYMVATDAIGMGLNMDVDHVAFASPGETFDGRAPRPVGRAGGGPDRRPRRASYERRHLRCHRRRAGAGPGCRSPAWSPMSSRRSSICFGATPACGLTSVEALIGSLRVRCRPRAS